MNTKESWKKWEKKGDSHLINRIQWDKNELEYMLKVPQEFDWFGRGEFHNQLEKKLSDFTEISYFNLTNSGSTAITTALKTLIELGELRRGDSVLHPITTFQTSIASSIDLGLVPVFVETKPYTFVIDETEVDRAIKQYPSIRGMVVPHLLGNIPDMEKITDALGDRFLIEDCCDSMGGYFDGKHIGSFGNFAAFSFYGSHHMTTGGVGGAIGTNDESYHEKNKSIIYWGHDFKPKETFLDRYRCGTIGSDFQMSGIQAGFGLAQIEKLPGFVKARDKQFKEMHNLFENYRDFFHLPREHPKAKPSWFCFPLVTKSDAPFTRRNFVDYLNENNVEIRPVMSANLLRQGAYKNIPRITLDNERFPIADENERAGMFIPSWGMPENQKQDYYGILTDFLDSYK